MPHIHLLTTRQKGNIGTQVLMRKDDEGRWALPSVEVSEFGLDDQILRNEFGGQLETRLSSGFRTRDMFYINEDLFKVWTPNSYSSPSSSRQTKTGWLPIDTCYQLTHQHTSSSLRQQSPSIDWVALTAVHILFSADIKSAEPVYFNTIRRFDYDGKIYKAYQ